VTTANDAVILGALGGYMSSDVRLTTTSTSTTANVKNGASTLNAHLEGPSAGAYLTYFNDRFSGDVTFRADFLSLSESFVDVLGFTVNATAGPPVTVITGTGVQSVFAGSGSTRLNNYTTTGNVNYRIPLSLTSWIEPTAGVQYTMSDYDASAAALGLTNGNLVKLQAGARFAIESLWGAGKLTTTVTGLAYDDVIVTGGFIQNVAFGNNALIINDQGLLRGQGILAFNLAYASGISLFAQGDVRGGKDLFGAGGKGGIRFQW
jgi:Autotransporter beta-domain